MPAQDNRTPQRAYGRAVRGQRTRSLYVKFRGERYSMVPIISAFGVMGYYLQEGGLNSADLCSFAERCVVSAPCSAYGCAGTSCEAAEQHADVYC